MQIELTKEQYEALLKIFFVHDTMSRWGNKVTKDIEDVERYFFSKSEYFGLTAVDIMNLVSKHTEKLH
jgi:hypothetical protein